MNDPFDQEFAKQLRESDRQVSFDWNAVKPTVSRRERHQAKRKRTQKIAGGIVACVLLGCLFVQLQSGGETPVSGNKAIVQSRDTVSDVIIDINEFSLDQQLGLGSSKPTLAQLKKKLKDVKQKLRRLDEIQAAQRLVILKEVVSRTEVNQQAIAAYHF